MASTETGGRRTRTPPPTLAPGFTPSLQRTSVRVSVWNATPTVMSTIGLTRSWGAGVNRALAPTRPFVTVDETVGCAVWAPSNSSYVALQRVRVADAATP